MLVADARAGMKKRLDIPAADTTFDDTIDQFVEDAVKRFAPGVYEEVDVQEVSVTVSDRGEAIVDLSALGTSIDDVKELEASAGDGEYPADTFKIHGTKMRVRELTSDVTSLFIYGLKEYTLDTIPPYLELPVYYFALSEFYTFLMANKAKYNVYMQNGRGAVDNMQDLVDFWEQKGLEYMADKGTPFGR